MSLATGDLTSLATAAAYLDKRPNDQVLGGLVTRVSRMIQTHLNRSLLVPKAYVRQFDGTGTKQLVLPDWPLITLTSLKVSGQVLNLAPQVNDTNAPPPTVPYGFRFQMWDGLPPGDPAIVELTGGAYYFPGHQNIVVSYSAGYQVSNEAHTIAAAGALTIVPTQPYGVWATDQGVIFADTGIALAPTTGVPTTGQYVLGNPSASPASVQYTFANMDRGRPILLNYGFIPADIEQVVLELIAERASYRTRIGIHSQSLAGQESLTYDNSGLPAWARMSLAPYKSVLPTPVGASL